MTDLAFPPPLTAEQVAVVEAALRLGVAVSFTNLTRDPKGIGVAFAYSVAGIVFAVVDHGARSFRTWMLFGPVSGTWVTERYLFELVPEAFGVPVQFANFVPVERARG